jgi:PAS domain S-box-containing protein
MEVDMQKASGVGRRIKAVRANVTDGAEEFGRRELVRLTPFLLVKVLLITLGAEFAVMLALPLLHLRSAVLEDIVDSFSLVALSVVPLHLLVLRPTMRIVAKSVAAYEYLSFESLRESEARHRLLFDGSKDAMMTLNPPSWKFGSGNPAALELFGVRDEAALTELGPWDVLPERQPDGSLSAEKAQEAIKLALREGSHFFDLTHRRLDGTDFYASVMLTRIEMAGQPFLQATVRDITATKLAEGKLRESEERFRIMADGVPTAMWTTDGKGKIQFINRAYREFSGLSFEQVEGSRWQLALHPEDKAEYVAALQRAVRERAPFRSEVRARNADGEWRWFATCADPRFSGSGEFLGHVGLSLDITERKQTEQALRDSEEKFRQLADNVSEVFWMMPPAANEILYISPAYEQVWGRSCESLYQNPMSWAEAIHPDDMEQAHLMFARQIQGELVDSEYRIRTPEGLEKWIRDRAFPIRDEGGQLIRVVGVAEDITERKRVEGELRKIASVVEASTDFIGFASPDGEVQYVNQAGRRMVGLDDEVSVDGMSMIDFVLEKERADFAGSILPVILRDGRWEGETGMKHLRTGARIPMWQSIFVLTDRQTNRRTGMATICRDLTERKREEDELRAAKQAAEAATLAKSEFLANMSHEIRTPMNGVIGMTGLLLDTELTEDQRLYAEIVRSSGESLLGIINNVLDFSKIEAGKLELEKADFDLQILLDDFAATLAVLASGKGLELFCSIDHAVPVQLRGDTGRLLQILNNLVGNAIKFTDKGDVVVSVSLLEQSGTECLLRFSVRDTGIGIPGDKIGKLFAGFSQVDASTTRKYGGTGLGLAISKQLAVLMGGSIGVESEEGTGSEFWFTVRMFREPLGVQTTGRQPAGLLGVHTLIVDDNVTSRHVLSALMTKWGMRPEEAADGPSALQALHRALEENDPFRVAVIDKHMPGTDGEALGQMIKSDQRVADARLILLTTLGATVDAWHSEAIGFTGHARKPIQQRELLDVLSKVLADNPRPVAKSIVPQALDNRWLRTITGVNALILVVEDNIVNQKVAVGILKKLGLRADTVADGAEAVRALESIPYDLVLMDVQMPVMDGIEATRQIRDEHSAVLDHDVPIIAMTAHAMPGDRQRFLDSGMNGYVSKPVSLQSLTAALTRWLAKKDGGYGKANPAETTVAHVDLSIPASTEWV